MISLRTLLGASFLLLLVVFTVTGQKKATPVNLTVTIDDTLSAAAGLRSDGANGGTYINGQSGVIAQLTDFGWFNFDTGTRTATVDFSTAVEVNRPLPVVSETRPNTLFKTFQASMKFQDMTVGSGQCAQAAIIVQLKDASGTNRIASFHRADVNTAWVYVQHPSATTWTLEASPQTPCGLADDSLSYIGRVLDQTTKGRPTPDVVYGRWFLPFRMTLSKQ